MDKFSREVSNSICPTIATNDAAMSCPSSFPQSSRRNSSALTIKCSSCSQWITLRVFKATNFGRYPFSFGQFSMEKSCRRGKAPVTAWQSHFSHCLILEKYNV
ncbi:hypothetical protein V8G54_022560 [Vigna mungo]|uniref:Uncharacterized protein n=1 Tax=Vigna mungo TaxID=3915 RepID=A0AAQ3N2Q6_VIGMU